MCACIYLKYLRVSLWEQKLIGSINVCPVDLAPLMKCLSPHQINNCTVSQCHNVVFPGGRGADLAAHVSPALCVVPCARTGAGPDAG